MNVVAEKASFQIGLDLYEAETSFKESTARVLHSADPLQD